MHDGACLGLGQNRTGRRRDHSRTAYGAKPQARYGKLQKATQEASDGSQRHRSSSGGLGLELGVERLISIRRHTERRGGSTASASGSIHFRCSLFCALAAYMGVVTHQYLVVSCAPTPTSPAQCLRHSYITETHTADHHARACIRTRTRMRTRTHAREHTRARISSPPVPPLFRHARHAGV